MTIGYLRIGTYADIAVYAEEIKYIREYNLDNGTVVVEKASSNTKLDKLKGVFKTLLASQEPRVLVTWDLHTLSAPGNDANKSNLLKLLQLTNWMIANKITLVLANPNAPEIAPSVWQTLMRYHTAIISEGKILGASRAKATGQHLGRPSIPLDANEVYRTVAKYNMTKSAKLLGVSRATLRNRLKEMQAK